MIERATRRPCPFAKPGYWDAAPPPAPRRAERGGEQGEGEEEPLNPTRYGDWVRKGIAVDF